MTSSDQTQDPQPVKVQITVAFQNSSGSEVKRVTLTLSRIPRRDDRFTYENEAGESWTGEVINVMHTYSAKHKREVIHITCRS